MKQIQTYHIEHYWQTKAVKRQKRAELKKKVFEKIAVGAFIILNAAITWEFCRQLFEII